ncbi:MAG: hypothetical protein NW215_09585 [Hyphomicrobiales bacterium]|nr:hypothetical protein [Hyphomicrobiales bacterium]
MTATHMDSGHAASKLRAYLSELARSIWLQRAPLIIVVLFSALMQHEQTRELYAIVLAGLQKGNPVTAILAIVSLIAFSLTVWAVGRDLSLADSLDKHTEAVNEPGPRGRILRNAPAVIACLPLIVSTLSLLSYSSQLERSFSLPEITAAAPVSDATEVEATRATTRQAVENLGKTLLRESNDRERDIKALLGSVLDKSDDTEEVIALLSNSFIVTGALTLAFALFVFWRANYSIVKTVRLVKTSSAWAFAALFTACLAAAAAQSAFPALDVPAVARTVGVILIINLFFICLLVFLAVLTRLNDVNGVPALTGIVALALIASAYNWNDNHDLRLLSRKEVGGADAPRPDRAERTEAAERRHPNARPLPVAFFDWFDNRPPHRRAMFPPRQADGGAGEPYPVYIVAAQGGGLYSAYFTAMTLARIYDRCPAMRHHVFAVSGVSGGAVGAGVFASLVNQVAKDYDASYATCPYPEFAEEREGRMGFRAGSGDPAPTPDAGPLEQRVKSYFAGDLLAPLAASALFADLPQRVFPFATPGVSEHLDRSRGFEAALESQWSAMKRDWRDPDLDYNPLREPFLDQWRPDGQAPMLMLNVTHVNTGKPMLVAPFTTDRALQVYRNNGAINSVYPYFMRGQDMRLSTALGLSARFPVVMSPASLRRNERDKQTNERREVIHRFGDGGYFENSGVDSALGVIRDLTFYKDNAETLIRGSGAPADIAQYENIEFRLLVLNEEYEEDIGAGGFHETLSPLLGLYNTRTQRGRIAIDRALASVKQVELLELLHDLFPMPLGWQFAEHTRTGIGAQIGHSVECPSAKLLRKRLLSLDEFLDEQKKSQGGEANPALAKLPGLARILNQNRCAQSKVIRAIADPPPLGRAAASAE